MNEELIGHGIEKYFILILYFIILLHWGTILIVQEQTTPKHTQVNDIKKEH
jgi:hypothetical protein